MRILLVAIMFTLCGCETVGEIVREKKYAFDIYETQNANHRFGYSDDHDYVGYFVNGKFGKRSSTHTHTPFCIHVYEEE